MNRYALISCGRVANVIMADPGAIDEIQGYDAIVQTDTAGPGWGWTPGGGFAAPEASEVPPDYGLPIPLGDFLRRFTMAERLLILARRKVDPVVDDYMGLMEAVGSVRPHHPDTLAGLGYLVQEGDLELNRVAEITGG